jgi:hypothetical protein
VTTSTNTTVQPGDKITILGPLSLPNPAGGASGIAYQRGAVIEITSTLLEDSRDRTGASLFDDLSEEQQTARWGRPLIAIGDMSATTKWWHGDSSSAKIAMDHARHDADRISDPEQRAAAYAAIREEFRGANLNPSNQYVAFRLSADADPHATQDAR